jgi:holliday junction DNA helicase RuvA
MIAWLKGIIKDRFEDRVILDQNGVGYEIQLHTRLASQPMHVGQTQEFYIYTYVREDILSLFGFSSWNEREVFLELIRVSGIGAKTAMAILSNIDTPSLVSAILHRDTRTLQAVKGIGKKAAEKIVLELADRMKQFQHLSKPGATSYTIHAAGPHQDLISALENLGYKRPSIELALAKMDLPEEATFDQLLKQSLKMLGTS